jgi:hypothetical protein
MRRRERERMWDDQWGDLATYNSEVSRGIVHTAEYDARMAEKQAAFVEYQRSQYPDLNIIEVEG